jgi:hypothetical protein
MSNEGLAKKGYERAVLGQASMTLLMLMQTSNHPKFAEYQTLSIAKENPENGFAEADKELLIKAYHEEPVITLEAFKRVPEVIEILGIALGDDLDD